MQAMLKPIDNFLNSITMYRLVLYSLTVISLLSFGISFIPSVGINPLLLIASLVTILSSAFVSNLILSKLLGAPINQESQWITGFLLFLIIDPPMVWSTLWVGAIAAAIAMLSKYLFAVKKKHLFNPVAISVVILALLGRGEASWWVANPYLLPVVVITGFLILRKLKRFELFFTFLVVALAAIIYSTLSNGTPIASTLRQVFLSWPIIFFAVFMLTEPQTIPPTRTLQIIYATVVGLLFGLKFHLSFLGLIIYSSPALALVIGNLFAYFVSPKEKLVLYLKEKREIALNTFEFSFSLKQKLQFKAGQYLEWTLSHPNPDSRGERRYFTIASSPTESDIKLGLKYSADQSSSFKRSLQDIGSKPIIASQLSGEFVLPSQKSKKLVFIAGGIGVTPFRSMIKYLIDSNERRDVVFFYSNKVEAEIAYRDIFDEAVSKLGIRAVYTLTDPAVSSSWVGKRGFISADMIKAEVSDYKERYFYLSGPHSMVTAFEGTLATMGVSRDQIKVDYFPGFA